MEESKINGTNRLTKRVCASPLKNSINTILCNKLSKN